MPQAILNSHNVYLYRFLENLLHTSRSSLSHSTALWHITDPSRLVNSKANNFPIYNPDQIVKSITFAQLNHLALKLAHSISNQIKLSSSNNHDGTYSKDRKQSETIVAIFMPPSIERVICQIACMILNVAYLPLDRQIPIGRISYMLDQVKPMLLITILDYEHYVQKLSIQQSSLMNHEYDICHQKNKFTIQNYEVLIKYSTGELPDENLSLRSDSTCCLFPNENNPIVTVLFTSGSTRNGPKAVYLRTKELINRLEWQWNPDSDMDLTKHDRKHIRTDHSKYPPIGLAKTAWVFVDAFTELFSCLLAGVPVVIPGGSDCPSEKCVSDVQQLIILAQYFRITHLTTVPAQLELWIKQLKLKHDNSYVKSLESLRTVVISGDILQPRLALDFFQIFPGDYRRLINLYGTTEVAGDVSGVVFKSTQDVNALTRTITRPHHNQLLTTDMQVLSTGLTITNCQILIVCDPNEVSEFKNWNLQLKSDQVVEKIALNQVHFSEIYDENLIKQLKASGLHVLSKGQIGEVCITGLPVVKKIQKFNEADLNSNTYQKGNKNFPNVSSWTFFRPGDIGFIDPITNQLYICGRTDDYIKRNGIRFHVREVDYLLEKLKQQHIQLKTDNILNDIEQTITLAIPEEWERCIQIVCFYMFKNSEDMSRYFQVKNPNQDKVDIGIERQRDIWMSMKLSHILKEYIPSCLLPKFIRVDRIPLMPTSGKVDKGYLRQLYEEQYSCRALIRNPILIKTVDSSETHSTNGIVKTMVEKHFDDGSKLKRNAKSKYDANSISGQLNSLREKTRRQLAEVLLLKDKNGDVLPGRPTDDEDFFELGGDSLLAVYAIESLRQMNHVVDLHLFSKTGNIGAILSYLEHPDPIHRDVLNQHKCDSRCEHQLRPMNHLDTNEFDLHKGICCQTWNKEYTFYIEEWNEYSSTITREQIVELMSSSFQERDKTGLAFGLTRSDHRIATENFLDANRLKNGIILTAQVPIPNSGNLSERQLVGVLISLPSSVVPELNCTPKLKLIQSYFDACVGSEYEKLDSLETGLTVVMLGISSRPPCSELQNSQEMISKWRKVTVDILTLMEGTLINLAKLRGFRQVDTLNTFEVTKEVCLELGYRITRTISLKAYMESQNMRVPSEYENLHCFFMVRSLK